MAEKLDTTLELLTEEGLKKGFLTYSEINTLIEERFVPPEKLDQIFLALEEGGIEVVDDLETDPARLPPEGMARLQKRLSLGGSRQIDGMFEVFNLFKHANYGSYTTQVDSANFGRPVSVPNFSGLGTAYAPRIGQLAFRVSF